MVTQIFGTRSVLYMHDLQDLGISEYLQDKPVENTKMCFPLNSNALETTTHGAVRVKGD